MTVIIVGGGIAGLKAAKDLHIAGVPFELFEARDRLGGRMYTFTSDAGHSYDLGASWFHDSLVNTLFHEEVEAGAKFVFDDSTSIMINENGDTIPQSISIIFEELSKFIHIEYQELDSKDVPLSDVVLKYLQKTKRFLTKPQVEYVAELARSMELWHGISWKDMSAKFALIDHGGRNAFALNYDQTWKRIANELPQGSIHLNSVVSDISRTESDVTVTLTDGQVFTGTHCVVAIPHSIVTLEPENTGYIKHQPPLPKEFISSIGNINFGGLGKVVLEFEACTWSTEFEHTVTLATPPEGFYESVLNGISVVIDRDVDKPWNHPLLWINLPAFTNTPSFIVLTADPLTSYLETLTEEQIWEYIKPMFQKVTKTDNRPNKVFTSKWIQDPFSRGAYSVVHPGKDPLSGIIAYETGLDRVRFAGEHTIAEGSGCVWGAWMSGAREAQYIINDLQ